MQFQLSQKERLYLEDLKNHEELCIQKYNKYANEAECSNLKQIFQTIASKEQQHYNTVNQLLSGQVPSMGQGQGGQGQSQQQGQQTSGMQGGQQGVSGMQAQGGTSYNQNDYTIVTDMLSTEKYISGTYDTAIFEFQDANVRQVLNHIQKEEQEHGEQLFNYMKSNGMYQVN